MRTYLSGKEPLWKAFWLFTVGGTIFIGLVGYCIYLVGNAFQLPLAQIGVIASILLLVPYSFLCVLAIWRCSGNTENVAWAVLAKGGVLFYVGSYLFGMFNVWR
jgi:hypothetical protein